MSILIVDDSQPNRSLLEAILGAAGHLELLTASTARDAFNQLGVDDPAGSAGNVDLILMDIMMPEIDGIEACRRIKAALHLCDIPIIMVTALTDVNYVQAAFDAGAMDYITKPLKKVEVLARVRSALSLGQEMEARKLAHVELEEKNQLLVRETLAKSQILSTVSHELMTPLTSIVGYADMLLLRQATVGKLNERQQRYVEVICESSHLLRTLINDLLDISRIEAGKLRIDLARLEVEQQIEGVVQAFQTQFQEKRIEVVLDIPSGMCPVYADAARFTQIVANLLSNACKYSQSGATVTISVREGAESVQIDVADTGIGISKTDQASLFTKFFRADNSAARKEPGSGLGLFIVKQLIEAQGGEIWAHSVEGLGSTFSFTLPRADVDESQRDTPVEASATVTG